MKRKIVGIDLGTANSIICVQNKGIVMRTPTLIAISKVDGSVVAVHNEAYRMLGKAPAGIELVRPLQNGVISNPTVTAMLINALFRYTKTLTWYARPHVIICVPYNITELEKTAVEDAVFEAGAGSVALIEEPLAAALGIGISPTKSGGNLIVDIGGGTTEASVINLGGIVNSNAIRVAGSTFDESIISYLCRKRGIRIGESQAEKLKKSIGSAHKTFDKGSLLVPGHSLENGLATEMKITSAEIRQAITPNLEQIIQTIKKTLETTSPQLSSDIFDRGIILTGGCAALGGIDRLITERTGLQVKIAPSPLYSVCLGIEKIIQSDGALDNLLQSRGR